MNHAIRIHAHGGPEVLRWDEVALPDPGPGEALVRHTAVGVNFIDTYHRSGLYPVGPLPSGLGSEAAGVVEAVGTGVTEVRPGDRVAYAGGAPGSYAERRVMPAARLVPLPPAIDDRTAAAALLKGMTVEYLVCRTYPVRAGETVLFHAAAGGVGVIACQWLKGLGATVIGTVSTDEKAELARAHGCEHPVVTARDDFVARVRELTGGRGVPVVYDSVGRDTFLRSLDCLAPRGMMVSFGNASGPPPALDPLLLAAKGSLFLTRPSLLAYTATREELLASAGALFGQIERGAVRVAVHHEWPLPEAAAAQRALEERRTVGSILLRP
jgi:NADPH2:quinone reductase